MKWDCKFTTIQSWNQRLNTGTVQVDGSREVITISAKGYRPAELIAMSKMQMAGYFGPKWLMRDAKESIPHKPTVGEKVVLDDRKFGTKECPVWDFVGDVEARIPCADKYPGVCGDKVMNGMTSIAHFCRP
jgi:hypothetical protein